MSFPEYTNNSFILDIFKQNHNRYYTLIYHNINKRQAYEYNNVSMTKYLKFLEFKSIT